MVMLETEAPLQGVAAGSGIAIGPAYWLEHAPIQVQPQQVADVGGELLRLAEARRQARSELERVQSHVATTVSLSEAGIFEAHLAFLDDPVLFDEIEELCRSRHCNVEVAVSEVFDRYSESLLDSNDELFQTRAQDIIDLKHRLLRLLAGAPEPSYTLPDDPCVILADDLLPSVIVQFDRQRLLGIGLAAGGPTSHVAILARSLGIPAVVGLGDRLRTIPNGTPVIIDGNAGLVFAHPSAQTLQRYQTHYQREQERRTHERAAAQNPAITRDGVQIAVLANLSSVAEAEEAVACGAEGVGLLRTELLFMDRSQPPSEAEQIALYNRIAALLKDRPLVIRTLDIGGDKPVPYLRQPPEQNPALGIRGVRLAQHDRTLLQTQVRAIWQIETNRSIKIMFPMVSTLDEIYWLRKLVADVRSELQAAGVPTLDRLEVGVMIEVPALALLADHVARIVDFMSIGTNDLTQYVVAVDRNNTHLNTLGDGLHPAVLRLIAQTIRAAKANGIPVSICGELAADPLAIPLCVGLGIDALSVSPSAIPRVKSLLRTLNVRQLHTITDYALTLPTAADIRRYANAIWGT